MMKHRITLSAILIATLCVGAFAATATLKNHSPERNRQDSAEQTRLAKQARITMEQARETALKRAPGNIESSELEREHGRLVYSFDIRNAKGTITEVQVNARNGRIVSVEEENARAEAREKRKEAQERTRSKHP
jgi:uncharacterized membrane protein YkoI